MGAAAQEEIARDLALDGQLAGEQEKPIDWNKVLREVRAAGVKAVSDECAGDGSRLAAFERPQSHHLAHVLLLEVVA